MTTLTALLDAQLRVDDGTATDADRELVATVLLPAARCVKSVKRADDLDRQRDQIAADWSDIEDTIWRRSLAEQHAAICNDYAGCTHYKSPKEG